MRWVLIYLMATVPLIGEDVDMRAKLVVRGEAKVEAPADQMTVTLGVVTQEKTAEAAINSNKLALQKVVDALLAAGIEKKEWETGRFSVEPIFFHSEKGERPPEIVAYRVNNTVNLKTSQWDKAGVFLDAAAKAGANSIENLQFGIKDARSLKSEAITAASKNAVADARTLADATGQKLVRLLEVILDEDTFSPAQNRSYPVMMAKMGGSMPLNPGDVTLTASVKLVYEVAP
jgi:uncharacterized protein YggE